MTVAETILAQLGGPRFSVMTGAKHYVGSTDSLAFQVMRNAAKVTHVRVTLNDRDLYDLRTLRIRGTRIDTLAEEHDVPVESLRAMFTRLTGLETSL